MCATFFDQRRKTMTKLEKYKAGVAAKFEKLFLIPFEWMEVEDAEFNIALVQGRPAKDLALDIGLAANFKPSIPDSFF
jgi:hypothetical protein